MNATCCRLPALLMLALLGVPPALAAEPSQGERLHAAHCTSCHIERYGGDGSEMYRRANRLIHSRSELDQRVAFCNKMVKAGLSADDEKAIGNYLNQHYYKFAP